MIIRGVCILDGGLHLLGALLGLGFLVFLEPEFWGGIHGLESGVIWRHSSHLEADKRRTVSLEIGFADGDRLSAKANTSFVMIWGELFRSLVAHGQVDRPYHGLLSLISVRMGTSFASR